MLCVGVHHHVYRGIHHFSLLCCIRFNNLWCEDSLFCFLVIYLVHIYMCTITLSIAFNMMHAASRKYIYKTWQIRLSNIKRVLHIPLNNVWCILWQNANIWVVHTLLRYQLYVCYECLVYGGGTLRLRQQEWKLSQ